MLYLMCNFCWCSYWATLGYFCCSVILLDFTYFPSILVVKMSVALVSEHWFYPYEKYWTVRKIIFATYFKGRGKLKNNSKFVESQCSYFLRVWTTCFLTFLFLFLLIFLFIKISCMIVEYHSITHSLLLVRVMLQKFIMLVNMILTYALNEI